jgi:hypothetical protein
MGLGDFLYILLLSLHYFCKGGILIPMDRSKLKFKVITQCWETFKKKEF